MDRAGKNVLEPLFENAKMLYDNIVGVEWDGKWDIIILP